MNPIARRTITALALAAALICLILYLPVAVFPWLLGVFGVLALVEYTQLLCIRRPSAPVFAVMFVWGFALLLLAFGVLGLVALREGNMWLLYTVAVVKISDMGGFAFGLGSKRIFGDNHKLCPSISPGKSCEGLFGSIFGSCLVSFGFSAFTAFPWGLSLAIAFTAALVGTLGDLVESKFKRWVGVKDSATMKFTNGMGGILDMFDSLLFAPLAVWLLILFFGR
ncbi:MAG: phosphatidate cytidylyltransferase [Kiritimatiellia bacterium]